MNPVIFIFSSIVLHQYFSYLVTAYSAFMAGDYWGASAVKAVFGLYNYLVATEETSRDSTPNFWEETLNGFMEFIALLLDKPSFQDLLRGASYALSFIFSLVMVFKAATLILRWTTSLLGTLWRKAFSGKGTISNPAWDGDSTLHPVSRSIKRTLSQYLKQTSDRILFLHLLLLYLFYCKIELKLKKEERLDKKTKKSLFRFQPLMHTALKSILQLPLSALSCYRESILLNEDLSPPEMSAIFSTIDSAFLERGEKEAQHQRPQTDPEILNTPLDSSFQFQTSSPLQLLSPDSTSSILPSAPLLPMDHLNDHNVDSDIDDDSGILENDPNMFGHPEHSYAVPLPEYHHIPHPSPFYNPYASFGGHAASAQFLNPYHGFETYVAPPAFGYTQPGTRQRTQTEDLQKRMIRMGYHKIELKKFDTGVDWDNWATEAEAQISMNAMDDLLAGHWIKTKLGLDAINALRTHHSHMILGWNQIKGTLQKYFGSSNDINTKRKKVRAVHQAQTPVRQYVLTKRRVLDQHLPHLSEEEKVSLILEGMNAATYNGILRKPRDYMSLDREIEELEFKLNQPHFSLKSSAPDTEAAPAKRTVAAVTKTKLPDVKIPMTNGTQAAETQAPTAQRQERPSVAIREGSFLPTFAYPDGRLADPNDRNKPGYTYGIPFWALLKAGWVRKSTVQSFKPRQNQDSYPDQNQRAQRGFGGNNHSGYKNGQIPSASGANATPLN